MMTKFLLSEAGLNNIKVHCVLENSLWPDKISWIVKQFTASLTQITHTEVNALSTHARSIYNNEVLPAFTAFDMPEPKNQVFQRSTVTHTLDTLLTTIQALCSYVLLDTGKASTKFTSPLLAPMFTTLASACSATVL